MVDTGVDVGLAERDDSDRVHELEMYGLRCLAGVTFKHLKPHKAFSAHGTNFWKHRMSGYNSERYQACRIKSMIRSEQLPVTHSWCNGSISDENSSARKVPKGAWPISTGGPFDTMASDVFRTDDVRSMDDFLFWTTEASWLGHCASFTLKEHGRDFNPNIPHAT